jgi:hypothetical protein
MMGRKVRICRVLMMPQICFIAIPRKAARKKLTTNEEVIPCCIV